jgi:hypothetical protein
MVDGQRDDRCGVRSRLAERLRQQPVLPVAWLPLAVGHRNDEDEIGLDGIEHAVSRIRIPEGNPKSQIPIKSQTPNPPPPSNLLRQKHYGGQAM